MVRSIFTGNVGGKIGDSQEFTRWNAENESKLMNPRFLNTSNFKVWKDVH
jgi:hypothetical protein